MVKFIDENRKNMYYTNEVIARCVCDRDILSFRTVKLIGVDEEGGNHDVPCIEVAYYGMSSKSKYSLLHIIGEESVGVFYRLLTRKINDGKGYVQTQEGFFIGVDSDEDEMSFHLLGKERHINLLNKSPLHYLKKMLWGASFQRQEANKIGKELGKFMEKDFGIVFKDEIDKKTEDEAQKSE